MTLEELLQQMADVAQDIKTSKHPDKIKAMLLSGYIHEARRSITKIKKLMK